LTSAEVTNLSVREPAALPPDFSMSASRFRRWEDVCKWLYLIAREADRWWVSAEYSEPQNVNFQ
jgi:hypothetical protein